jgi:RNA polymerase sigma-70 factor (ECF subfamily)
VAVLNEPASGRERARGRDAAPAPDPASRAVEAAFRDEWARVVATLIRVTGDWSLAEDAAAEAFAAATRTWPADGVPDRPGAWLTTVARRAALDRLRRQGAELRALRRAASDPTVADPTGMDATGADPTDVDPAVGRWAADGSDDDGRGAASGLARGDEEVETMPGEPVLEDDLLRLVFTCCHPALPPEARVALTLRTVTGLEVAEVAAAFGVRADAMAKRLVRARAKIAHAHIPYRVPRGTELAERLDGVLAVVYLVFTEGYAPTSGVAVRGDLADRALHLAAELSRLLPRESEAHGLRALLLLHDSRRAARVDADAIPVALDEQDRALWDLGRVRAGLEALAGARAALGFRGPGARPGPYLLQAEIAACHASAGDPSATPWPRVVALYDALLAVAPTPSARLARAVAVGMAAGLDAGLAALAALDDADPGLRAAAEADLLRRAGLAAEAADAYRRAIARTDGPTRRFLERRLSGLAGDA